MPGPFLFALGLLVTLVTAIAIGLVGVLDIDDLSVGPGEDRDEDDR